MATHSSLKPMDRGAWQATVPKVAESQTQLRRQHAHTRQVTFFMHSSERLNVSRSIRSR